MNTDKPYTIEYRPLPDSLPVFPLHGVLLLPGGQLPLNVFEPRYLQMFDDALRTDRLIGMIQPRTSDGDALYDIGCAGRIIGLTETPDGRYEIMLQGISRFKVVSELKTTKLYRRVQTDWDQFVDDFTAEHSCLGMDRDKLKDMLTRYFEKQEMNCDWEALEKAPDMRIMTCLAMACPFDPAEKQALLEQKSCQDQAKMFVAMLEMELYK